MRKRRSPRRSPNGRNDPRLNAQSSLSLLPPIPVQLQPPQFTLLLQRPHQRSPLPLQIAPVILPAQSQILPPAVLMPTRRRASLLRKRLILRPLQPAAILLRATRSGSRSTLRRRPCKRRRPKQSTQAKYSHLPRHQSPLFMVWSWISLC
jgi:hypothetical protein